MLSAMGGTFDGEERTRTRVHRAISSPGQFLAVAAAGADLLGYAWAHQGTPHLRGGLSAVRLSDLFVVPSHRRRGAGRSLFDAVLTWARAIEGAAWLEWQANQSALAFYERMGFQGDPCPDPGHPYFEIALPRTPAV
jgi:GNAT superfamily N-acetyltransferase